VIQPQLEDVQGLAGQLDRQLAAAAISCVAQDWMAQVGAVDADLMGATRIQLEAQ
jgi:hypothetical protein